MTDIQSFLKKDNRPFYKKKRFIIPVAVVALGAFTGLFKTKEAPLSNTSTVQTVSSNVSVPPEQDLNTVEKTRDQLKRELASLEKPTDMSSFKGSITSVQMGLVLFSAYSTIIKQGKESSDAENKKLADQLQKKVTVRQIKNFPILRKYYAEAAAEKLWESNIYMKTSGSGNSTANLTGGLFASNKTIAETQRTLTDVLKQFRFKHVIYRWYKDASDGTMYTLDTPEDSEPIEFKENQ